MKLCITTTVLMVLMQLLLGCGDRYFAQNPGSDADLQDSAVDGSGLGDGDAAGGFCGDGVAGPNELCDGADLGGLDCVGLGFFDGSLTCRTDCTLDTTGCRERCGNGQVDPGESCDGTNLDDQTCQGLGLGLDPGVLGCRSDCTLNLTGCPGCGNGVLEATEACDGTDFGGESCAGSLACTVDCRIDAGGCAVPGAGTGADGPLYVDAPMELGAPLAASWIVTSLGTDRAMVDTSPSGLTPGDEVILINLQGTDAICDAVGVYEFLTVLSTTSDSVVFGSNVQHGYGEGGGNTNLTGQAVVLQRVPNLSALNVVSGGTLSTMAWNGRRGGLLVVRVNGPVTVEAGGAITATGLGYRAGLGLAGTGRSNGRQGESTCGNPQAIDTTPYHGGGGGGVYLNTSDDCGQGGGGGGFAEPGTWKNFTPRCVSEGASTPATNGGDTYGTSDLAHWYLGSGGGSGATDDHSNTSGTGGRGGGILAIFAQSYVIDGALRSAGTNGLIPADYTDSGNGGGGAGGTLLLQAGSLDGSGLVSTPGGLGAPSQNTDWNSPGGDGAVGRIRIDYQSADGFLPSDPLATGYLEQLCSPAPGYSSLIY
jgi:hypothetical protein